MNRSFVGIAVIATLPISCATSRIPKERHVTLTTKVNFRSNSVGDGHAYYTLEIESGGEDRSICWPANAPSPGSLARGHSYTVEFFEAVNRSPTGADLTRYRSPDLFRFRDGDRMLYDASVCRAHGVSMERTIVPISYGFPMFDREYSKAMDADFPNTGIVLGGCCVNTERLSTREWVCPTCVEHKKRWENMNPNGAGKAVRMADLRRQRRTSRP